MPIQLVTGGAGFIGSHLVRALLGRGDEVRVLDNLSTGSRDNLAGLNVELVAADLNDAPQVRAAARGAETIFHLAAMISVPSSMDQPIGCYRANVLGSLQVLEAARWEGVRRVVFSSSCAVYGDSAELVTERSTTRPLSPYAASKLAMEDLARLYAASFGVQTVSLRYFNVYGPNQDPTSPYAAVIPIFVQAMLRGEPVLIHGDGHQTRDFVFVEDVVDANLRAAAAAQGAGETFNIGSGRSVSILDLASALRALIPGSPEPLFDAGRPGDIFRSGGDIAQATRTLGYRPAHDLQQGLAETVEWMRRRSRP
jgi:nucleoside-diphosphate-sugar epimerase